MQNNGICGRGVAPSASIVGLRLIAGPTYDYEEAQALSHRNDRVRIYSNSWGPTDDGMHLSGPGQVTKAALKQGYESGNGIFVWAGGNGRQSQDNSNYDGYANSPYTLAIGAINHYGQQSYYSESGANLMAVAPSSGANKGITTTDLMGRAGYSQGQCTNHFGGTSSAAPLAAGVIALMLEARPQLRVRDIQHIIAKRANKSVRGGLWSQPNQRGYSHSNEFGFGLLKVNALLDEAKHHHQLVPHPVRYVHSTSVPGTNIPCVVHVSAPSALSFVEQVLVTVSMSHDRRGQVGISVQSLHTTSVLAETRGDAHSGSSTWTYSTLRHWGEELKRGNVWTVHVTDSTQDAYVGSVQTIQITWMGY